MSVDQMKALTLLVAAVAGVLLILVVGFIAWRRPEMLFKLRHGDSELEIRGTGASGEEDESEEPDLQAKPGATESGDVPEEEPIDREETEEPGTYSLLVEGQYDEGMRLLRKELEDVESEDERLRRLAFSNFVAAVDGGVNEAVDELRGLAETYPGNSDVHLWFGMALRDRREEELAADEFRTALEHAADDTQRASAYRALARLLWERDRRDEAIRALRDATENLEDGEILARIYTELGDRFEERDDFDTASAMYEQAVALAPADIDLRFKVAYKYSEHGLSWFALNHYRALLSHSPEYSMAANNAGVACNQLDLDISAVDYFQTSEDAGNSLATANLARRYLEAGFRDEATAKLETALAGDDPHPNVPRVMGTIADEEDQEDEKQRKGLERARSIAEWQQRSAKARLRSHPTPAQLSGSYNSDIGSLDLNVEESGRVGGSFSQPEVVWNISGKLLGSALVLKLTEKKESDGRLLPALKAGPKKKSALFVEENEGELYGVIVDEKRRLKIQDSSTLESLRFVRVPD